MTNLFFHAHSGVRYLVLLAGVIVVGYALFRLASGRGYGTGVRIAGASFAGLLHLQVLLGFALLFSDRFHPQLIGHILMMIMAAVVAQIPVSVLKRRPLEERTVAPHLVGGAAALLLVIAGILSIGRPIL